ncbi:MAG: aspartate aminotransferase [Gammaproteobacteria bacterium RIFCSPHIGHO2_12_FULL_41_15]|nr:MAG: aspartate aminotransferase [Gammaproteobacteria bacterium RIFCSPHIGHO2_12_FULL_41_15]
MSILLSERSSCVRPSPTLVVTAKAAKLRAEGKDVIGLGAGEPDFDTPEHIKAAAIAAIESGFTKYTAVDGIAELKQAIQSKFKRDNKFDFNLNQILVSVGGKHSCFNLCQALLNKGDEAIIPAPYWVSYPDIVLLAGGVPVIVEANIVNSFKITKEQLAKAITPKTKLFWINSPSNPSGIAYTLDELKALAAVLEKHPQIVIATDDMYEHIIWSQPFCNILNAAPQLKDRTIVLNGVSKAYAMTGWRIGYAAGPIELITAMTTIQSQATSNPCSIAQKAAVAALNGDQECVAQMLEAFHDRHDYVVERLLEIPGIEVKPADGTFYLFPSVAQLIEQKGFANDIAFAEALLHDVGVAMVPGSAFGTPGCIRLSFATSMNLLREALDRLERFCLRGN